MVAEAIALGMTGIGIADRNSVAGVVRAWAFLKELQVKGEASPGFRLVVGARIVFADGTPDIVAYPVSRHGWGRLTRLLSTRSEEHTSELQSLKRTSYAVFCLKNKKELEGDISSTTVVNTTTYTQRIY